MNTHDTKPAVAGDAPTLGAIIRDRQVPAKETPRALATARRRLDIINGKRRGRL